MELSGNGSEGMAGPDDRRDDRHLVVRELRCQFCNQITSVPHGALPRRLNWAGSDATV
jgi:hypothetical protein